MLVHIVFTAQARVAAGCDGDDVTLPDGATVVDALRSVADASRAELREFLFRGQGEVQPTLMIVRNDVPVPRREVATTTVVDQDVITVIPPVAGG